MGWLFTRTLLYIISLSFFNIESLKKLILKIVHTGKLCFSPQYRLQAQSNIQCLDSRPEKMFSMKEFYTKYFLAHFAMEKI